MKKLPAESVLQDKTVIEKRRSPGLKVSAVAVPSAMAPITPVQVLFGLATERIPGEVAGMMVVVMVVVVVERLVVCGWGCDWDWGWGWRRG